MRSAFSETVGGSDLRNKDRNMRDRGLGPKKKFLKASKTAEYTKTEIVGHRWPQGEVGRTMRKRK